MPDLVVGFGVRQLAAAFLQASSLAARAPQGRNNREQARGGQSGSKLPRSKMPARYPRRG
jgi:hypothetical protein